MNYQIRIYTFNPFQENTYLLYDDEKNAIIIDPGCYTNNEKELLNDFITKEKLKIRAIFNTHCHIDHIFGNKYFVDKYDVDIYTHQGELETLFQAEDACEKFGFDNYETSPIPTHFVAEGDEISIGQMNFKVMFVPGHSIAHIAFYDEKNGIIFSGDVLFKEGFGRYDLPGGNLQTLKNSIFNQLFRLPDDTVVYPGHGPQTIIGDEKKSNMILSF